MKSRIVNSIKSGIADLIAYDSREIGLDIIRIIAIFYVFYDHAIILIPKEYHSIYNTLISIPIDGVSTFFALSGFLIGNIFNREKFINALSWEKVKTFWLRRFYRIVPNYYVVLLILLLLGADSKNFSFSFVVFCQNLFTLQPNFYKVAWSLSVEMWFYFLFPLSVLLAFKTIKNKTKALISCFVIFVVMSFLLRLFNFIFPEIFQLSSIRRVILFRLDSMMFGMIASAIYLRRNDLWKKYTPHCTALGVLLLLGMMLTRTQSDAIATSPALNPGNFSIARFYSEVTIYYVEALGILYFFPLCTRIRSFSVKWVNQVIVCISKLSYSIYLTHASLVLWFLIPILDKNNVFSFTENETLLLYLSYIVLTLCFSLVLYIFIELPFMNYREKLSLKK